MGPGIERLRLLAQRSPRLSSAGSRDAGKHERRRGSRELRRGSCPWPAHEGGTVPHKTLDFADFVRSRTAQILSVSRPNSSTFWHVGRLQVSGTLASLLNL